MSAFDKSQMLEVGNVLSHYGWRGHDVLDKYERAHGVINKDAVDFSPGRRYDLIPSISTLEHIGVDEAGADRNKALKAVINLVGLLSRNGKLVATIPLGHNADMDALVTGSVSIPVQAHFLKKTSSSNQWEETDAATAMREATKRSALRETTQSPFLLLKNAILPRENPAHRSVH